MTYRNANNDMPVSVGHLLRTPPRCVVRSKIGDESPINAKISFPDYFWDDAWWLSMRAASHYATALKGMELPPIPEPNEIRTELDRLLEMQASDERERRRPEILEEAEQLPRFYFRILFLDDPGNPKTRALFYDIVQWSIASIMYFKHQFKRPRPSQLEPRLKPMVDIPRHPAFPSGHSTQTHLISLLMADITGRRDIADALWASADRVAENREYAGLHYPSDSRAGCDLARHLYPIYKHENEAAIENAKVAEW